MELHVCIPSKSLPNKSHFMKRVFSLFQKHWLFLIILGLSLFFRLYRLDELTTFGGDQGQDFLVVYDMVVHHKLTLIGIKTSIAGFFQGPIYLYMLFPAFWLMNLNPLAGPLSAVFISIITLIILYFVSNTFFSQRVALIGSALFAVSPQFIRYGNTPLYQHFLPLFILLSIYTYLRLLRKRDIWLSFILGLTVGLGMELHFLNVTLALAFIIILFFKRFSFTLLITYLGGLLVGLSPTVTFELRHNFLNTRLFLQYFQLQQSTQNTTNFLTVIQQWIKGASAFLGGDDPIFGAILLLFAIVAIFRGLSGKNSSFSHIRLFTIVSMVILLIMSFIVSGSQAHYLLPLWVVMLIVVPLVFKRLYNSKKLFLFFVILLLGVNILTSARNLFLDHGYDMPKGWTMKKAIRAGDIISRDAKTHPNFNVAFLLDGNTRTYPIRYVLASKGIKPQSAESYPASDYLYVISRGRSEDLLSSQVWEITSLSPFTIGERWNLDEGIYLYRIERNKKPT